MDIAAVAHLLLIEGPAAGALLLRQRAELFGENLADAFAGRVVRHRQADGCRLDPAHHVDDMLAVDAFMRAHAVNETLPAFGDIGRQALRRLGQAIGDDQPGPGRREDAAVPARAIIPLPGQLERRHRDGARRTGGWAALADGAVELEAGAAGNGIGLFHFLCRPRGSGRVGQEQGSHKGCKGWDAHDAA